MASHLGIVVVFADLALRILGLLRGLVVKILTFIDVEPDMLFRNFESFPGLIFGSLLPLLLFMEETDIEAAVIALPLLLAAGGTSFGSVLPTL